MNSMNLVCLHFHIFKNAGTTIDWIFEKNFSDKAARIDVDSQREILSMDVVLNFLKKNTDTKSLTSHQIRFPIPENNEFTFLPIVFIREPLDRAFSIYRYNKKRADVRTQGIANAKKMTLSQYIQWNLDKKPHKVMKNFQTYFLANSDSSMDVTSADLETAISNLKNCLIIGVVDRFDESLVIAEDILKKYFSDIDLSYVKRKVSEDRKNSLKERIDDSKKQIGEKLIEDLQKENEFDLKLYKFANQELDDRTNKIDNFDEKLIDFKLRCKKLHEKLTNLSPGYRNPRMWYSSEKNLLYHENKSGKQTILYKF